MASSRVAPIPGARIVVLAALIVGMAAAILPASAPAASSSGPVKPCNGSVELCSEPFDEVVLPGSHNSMSAADLDWLIPNHDISIPEQLRRGARAMLIDTYYAEPDASLSPFKFRTLGRTEGSAAGATMYLCHVTCTWGATELIPEFRKIREFLAKNPREVMVFVNQDDVTPADFATAVEESGLIDFTYTGSTEEWPTLQQMIDSSQRVVFLAEAQAAGVDWYHRAYDGPMQETDYTFSRLPSKWRTDPQAPESPTYAGVDKLTDPDLLARSCDPNRGGMSGDLFLMNHWISGGPLNPLEPDPEMAAIVNTRQALVNRARACEAVRGKLPTILAVDFFGIGDTVGAARELNGVEADAFLELAKPKNVTVKAGLTGTFRLSLSNIGTAPASGVRFCASVPARLASPRTCVTTKPVAAGGKTTASLRIRTKPKARGQATVRFTVTASGDTLRTAAVLKVQPVKKRR